MQKKCHNCKIKFFNYNNNFDFSRSNKFCFVLFFCLTLLYSISLQATMPGLLEGNYYKYGSPLVVNQNVSQLTFQNGIPIGFSYSYVPVDKNYILRSGFIIPFSNNGLSFSYSRVPGKLANQISSGFSHKEDIYSLGGAFTFSFNNNSPLLSIDISSSLNLDKETHISLSGLSLLGSDSCRYKKPPVISLGMFGPIPKCKDILDYDIMIRQTFPGYTMDSILLAGEVWINSSLFEKNPLYLNAGYILEGLHSSFVEAENGIGLDIGTSISFGSISISLFAGYRYGLFENNNTVCGALVFNPAKNMDNTPPEIYISSSKGKSSNGVYISINCKDQRNGSGVKKWALILADAPSTNAFIIKTFSGGNIPPSSILWDYRDSKGVYYDKGVFMKFVAVDNYNNSTSTEWQLIR